MGLTLLIVFDTVILILKDSFRLRLMLKKMNPQVFRFSCGFFLCLTMYAIICEFVKKTTWRLNYGK